mmetsp:Transcript_52493/g.94118  ORF Transcript_52493/g.94118 Transcript_52493/m.94118 type:complete len:1015 (+) Transcript_52493:136-3180(+)
MGQQASAPDDSRVLGSQSSSSSSPRKGAWCKGGSADAYEPNRAVDSIFISHSALKDGLQSTKAETTTATRELPTSGFRCGLGLMQGRDVEVSAITSTAATVTWAPKEGAHKFHVNVSRAQGGQPEEVAFFEAPGEGSIFTLPEGTLEKKSGPYQVEVVAEFRREDRSELSRGSISEKFYTTSDPPGAVVNLQLSKLKEDGFSVEWEAPAENGGDPVNAYEVQFFEASKYEVPTERSKVRELAEPHAVTCREPKQSFSGLRPGSGPHRVEVRAKHHLLGPATVLEVFTACAKPFAPTQLRARLMPGWARSASGTLCNMMTGWEQHGADGPSDADVDVVKLEFRPPTADGGQSIKSYIIHAEEEANEDASSAEGAKERGSVLHSAEIPASAMVDSTSADDGVPPTGACICHITVEPNRAYAFSVEASNGEKRSDPTEPTSAVFVPARVPRAPRAAPEALEVDGGLAAELRWVGPVSGGGLPLESFKVGVLLRSAGTPGYASAEPEIQHEVSVPVAVAAAKAKDWKPRVAVHAGEALYGARVDGLRPDARYCFVLAASNSIGTGRWSLPSISLSTPAAAPSAPVNAVATVGLDMKQQVVVTVTWECGQMSAGSGSIAAFDVLLVPADMGQVRPSAEQRVVRERVAAQSVRVGQRLSWAKPLTKPGSYIVEVVAENLSGQRSSATVLSFDVMEEAFPLALSLTPPAPRWSEEPALVLGPAAPDAPRFADFDCQGWLQTLLLWRQEDKEAEAAARQGRSGVTRMSSGSVPSSIDVICYFRRPGSGQVFRCMLAEDVSASRLQVALPPQVPLSIRLVVHGVDVIAATQAAPVQSEPLVLLMSEDGERLQPFWEIWSRHAPDGQPPRWTSLPEEVQHCIEGAWLEGHPKVNLQLPEVPGEPPGALSPGLYELTFGDERQTQSMVRKLGPAGWTAKARRTVLDNDGEDAAEAVSAEDQCVICMERRRTHAFMHNDTGDGHLAVCGDCAEAFRAEVAAGGGSRAVRTCPMCRRFFTSIHRIYQ